MNAPTTDQTYSYSASSSYSRPTRLVIVAVLAYVLTVVLALALAAAPAGATRIKDMADIQGVRSNQLGGYGLIIGLDGTGDKQQTQFTTQSLASMLERHGVKIANPNKIKVENVAAVMVTAVLPPFARAGSRIDVLVSSVGDAESLQGGTLLLTPLRGANGEIYAVAQGPISIGGFSAQAGGDSVQKNHPTVGKIANGALVEREIPMHFGERRNITLALREPDFTTASRVVNVINHALDTAAARAGDAGTVLVDLPLTEDYEVVGMIALIESLEVIPDMPAKVVLNERTGTVVIGEKVRISTVAVTHGGLSIQVKEEIEVSQPAPFGEGETVVVSQKELFVQEEGDQLTLLPHRVSIGELIRALNALGVTPRDMIAILQAIKAAGALQAELEII